MLQDPQHGHSGKWLKTPVGWARANIWYEKLGAPPTPGTWQEALSILVWVGRQEQQVAATRAVAQASIKDTEKEARKAFENYLGAMFPYREKVEQKAKENQQELLRRWTGVGPIRLSTQYRVDREAQRREEQRQRGEKLVERDAWKAGFVTPSTASSPTPGRAIQPAQRRKS